MSKPSETPLAETVAVAEMQPDTFAWNDCSSGTSDITENPSSRCALMLVLDTSSAMSGEPIHELNTAIKIFIEAMHNDDVASYSIDFGIISAGSKAIEVLPLTTVADIQNVEPLQAIGLPTIGQAVMLALRRLDERNNKYKQIGVSHSRPWLFIVSTSEPSDAWHEAAHQAQSLSEQGKLEVVTVGIEGINLDILSQFSTRSPAQFSGMTFREFFEWLSASISRIFFSSSVSASVLLKPPMNHPVSPQDLTTVTPTDLNSKSVPALLRAHEPTIAPACPAMQDAPPVVTASEETQVEALITAVSPEMQTDPSAAAAIPEKQPDPSVATTAPEIENEHPVVTASRETPARETVDAALKSQANLSDPALVSNHAPSQYGKAQQVWYVLEEAAVGLAHRAKNLPCQDAAQAVVRPRPAVIVADGAGSSVVSEIGARAVVNGIVRLLDTLEKPIAEALDSEASPAEDRARYWGLLLVKHAIGLLKDLATEHRRELRDFRCTLLLAVVGKKRLLWLKVGDGALVLERLVLQPSGYGSEPKWLPELTTLGELGKGEFANQTQFLDSIAPSDVQIGLLDTDTVSGIAVMSDGATEKLVSNDGHRVASRVSTLLQQLRQDKLRRSTLTQMFYEEEFCRGGSGDDRSIALAACDVSPPPKSHIEPARIETSNFMPSSSAANQKSKRRHR